jgi:hypothetical protein
LQGTYVGKTTLIKALAFEEQKNLSVLEWIRRFRFVKNDRTFNTAGMYTDASGNNRFMIMKPIITNKIIINCIGMKKYQRTGGLI